MVISNQKLISISAKRAHTHTHTYIYLPQYNHAGFINNIMTLCD